MIEKILVVGAGISGAALARKTSDGGKRVVDLIDSRPHVAGNAYDRRTPDGIMEHVYGSHIFHTSNEEVWHFLNQFTGFNGYRHRVLGMVEGKEIPIPFSFESIRACFPEEDTRKIISKLLDRYEEGTKVPIMDLLKEDDPDLRALAGYVYEHVFLHYTEKQWGKSPEEIDGAITARVPVYVGESCGYFRDAHQGIPVDGYTAMVERMLDSPNVHVMLNTPFSSVEDPEKYTRIFYTGPVDELLGYRFGLLPYRSERFEVETLDREHYQDNAVVNYPDAEHAFTRVHEYKYYLGDKSDRTVIAREYPEPFEVGKNERYYPVPSPENEALHARYVEEAKREYPNMRFLGRLGDYRYYDMDKAVARAMEVYREEFER